MHISGQSLIPDFSPGWCSFDAVVYQYCEDSGVMTFLDVSPLYDGAGKQFMEQTDSINLTRGKKLRSMVVEKELRIRFEHDSVQFSYGNKTHWPNRNKKSKFTCTAKPWQGKRLDCDSRNRLERSQDVSCNFECVLARQQDWMEG
ncbi:hypothetical protein ACJQWK_10341 [Exserohilum turcicum]|uniref:Uncharacterized protein n=1 Tax=Exserohilum turcicum (strain 28A) TaxID=671987 RepID=R0KD17_EXST2|nr:uncharacterized protein SETTUDRAFT_19794 [Exserohilum turcica Et28A]EOA87269.1 hypothetical protein SETTUDRAFT_19794 [Exserohilum turcica Et28A]